MKTTILFLSFLMSLSLFAKPAKLYAEKGLFLHGYDPVAYLKSNKAEKGSDQHQLTYKGVKILFANKINKEDFNKNPESYIPAYNGWCAYAMAKSGDLVEIDPESFKVIDKKVYLFYNGFWANTLKKWNKAKNEKQEIKNADQYWQKKHL